ncbi:type II secretion system protein [Desulfonema magnum]|uniref:Prepilin-type cleavage/methylation domain-containing protein n=1 Tax=Desulfonema magnum TaxID=45655 RepID=A0A975BV11_9BACT|nr:prepilin-type N-terminal cleavage/methylation domain-containing protein [Desulfonema magnum]QTA92012.1 Prepilin-type cleavage/methylation domain-containing protein [Desulfonema magnum]
MKIKDSGFTFVELIASLILIGIAGAIAGLGLVQIADGFIYSKKNAETVQKAGLAMSRLAREFGAASSVISASSLPDDPESVKFRRDDDEHTVSWAGKGHPLKIDDDILIDSDAVESFNLTYLRSYYGSTALETYPPVSSAPSLAMIEITLSLKITDETDSTFTKRVFLRNLE